STILEWDIETSTRSDYFQNYAVLTTYLARGSADRRHVARCIRPLLEEYLRLKCPDAFCRTEWLGEFIEKIRHGLPGTHLFAAQAVLQELQDINGFAKRYHHAENPGADSEPITDGELQSYVKRTIAVIARF